MRSLFLFAASALFCSHVSAHTRAVNLDPLAAGIQDSLTVMVGDAITVDVLFISDGQSPVDSFAFAVEYDSLPAPFRPASYDPTLAGAAAQASIPVNLFALLMAVPGAPLTSGSFAPAILPESDGGGGVTDLNGELFAGGLPPLDKATLLTRTVLLATAPGTGSILVNGLFGGSGPGASAFFAATGPGGASFYDTASGRAFESGNRAAIITAEALPEPTGVSLLALGLLTLGLLRRRA